MTRRKRNLLIAVAALLLVGVGVATYLFLHRRPDDTIDVPLGVEEAVIITYSGNPIEPTPYKWGVAVNVRIAGVTERDNTRVYDVRYIVNRTGDFDLKDFLRSIDGKPAADLPSFKMRGSEKLSKGLDARIAETENFGISLHAWYYETLVGLAVFWIVWLLLLIFWRRRKPVVVQEFHAEPTLADEIRRHLALLESGALDARQQAQLELMIFRQWRDQRRLGALPMAEALEAFRADPEVSQAYAELENWLHRRDREATAARVAETVRSRIKATAPIVPPPIPSPGAA
jgi:hypothetical protein